MLHTKKPQNFHPTFDTVSCFIEYDGKILLLLRHDHKNEPNTYCLPGGKVDHGESVDDAMIREIFEETGLSINDAVFFQKVYVQYPSHDFIYHMHHKTLDDKPVITIRIDEHKKYIRRTPQEAIHEHLIQDLDVCIRMFYGLS